MSNYTARPITMEEEKYVFPKSSEIMAKSGFMGSARMNFGKDGEANTNYRWEPFGRSKQTEEFTLEVADVLNSLSLQSEEINSPVNSEGKSFNEKFGNAEIGHKMTEETQYVGLRVDSDKYSYLMCINPTRCWHNVYCYCYEKQWLDKQISKAHKGIRFVDNEYDTKFRIPDGGQITITASDGNKSLYTCRYIDDYHMELTSANGSSDIQHIHQFAEKMARWGATYEPAEVVSTPVPDAYLTNEKVKTPRGTFSLTAMSKEQMEKAGYGVHHMTEDNQFYIMGNGKRAFAVSIDRDDPINRDTQPKEPTSLIQPKKNKDYER